MKKLITPLIAVLFSTLALQASANIYKWTDASGKTHYSQTPPADAKAKAKDMEKELHIQSKSAPKTDAKKSVNPEQVIPPDEPKDIEEAKAKGKENKAKTEEFCKGQDIALKQLLANTLIRWKDEKGERILTAEERDAKVKEAENNLKTMCTPEVLGTSSSADEKKE